MAKKKKKKAAKRAAKPVAKRARKGRRSVAKRAERTKPKAPTVDRSLPEGHVVLSNVDSVTLIIEEQDLRFEAKLQQSQDRLERQATLLAELGVRVNRIELAQQAPPRDPGLDTPASVKEKRLFFAGFCKTLNAPVPSPAIIGRVMHEGQVFSPKNSESPRNLLERIYAKNPRHIAPKIRELLERYGDPSAVAGKKAGKVSGKIAEDLGNEFDKRFALIVNIDCGRKESVKSGAKTNYHRYLTDAGRELFDHWPDWSDETGGIGIAGGKPAAAPSRTTLATPIGPTPTHEPATKSDGEPTSPAP